MKKLSRMLLAMLLVAAMLCSMLPVYASAAPIEEAPKEISKKAEEVINADIWSKIDRFEEENIIETRDDPISAQDYAELSDEIEEIVKQSDTYVEGTIVRNGEFFTWETSEGIVCGYSPELRFKTRNNAEVGEDTIEVKSYATKASPSSKDVYLIAPYYGYDSSFTDQYKNEANSIASATGGKYTLYQGTNATITNIATAMQNGGVVIFDSHGITDYDSGGDDLVSRANTSYLCIKSSTGITSTDMKAVSGTYGTYYHAFNGGSAYCIDGTAISNHMSKAAPGTILWMAICLGMATNGLCIPMRNAGVEVVYGYSQSVSFTGDYKFETYFWNKMKSGSDVATAVSYMKSAAGCNWDPAYSSYSQANAVKYYAAFPIVVSDQDTYPGQGKVDAVQTVKSTYKLIESGSGSGSGSGSSSGDSTGDNNTEETYTYNLVTSASALTAGEYILIAAANGSYAGDYSYYALSTEQDGDYATMQANGVGFTSVPSAITCGVSSVPYFAFNLAGNANGFTLSNSNGSLEGGSDSDGIYLYYNNATTWTASYSSSTKGFQIKGNNVYLALRDDISTMGTNGAPMFVVSSSTSTGTTTIHMYKREGSATCTHSSTSTSTTPATCTTPGATNVTCNACGTVVSSTTIPALGHNLTYTSNNNGTHLVKCSRCSASSTTECTYNGSTCKYCGYVKPSGGTTESETDTYELVTSASDLTSGSYLIMATATGSYAGNYSYYIMTTTADGEYAAMQSGGLNFDSLPGGLLLDRSGASKYVWTITGNANGFTVKESGGQYLVSQSGSTAMGLDSSATTWKGSYSSSKYGFQLTGNSRYMALRDDIDTVGTNSAPLFCTVSSTGYNIYMHLYKRVEENTECTHANTSTDVTPATCTEAGKTVVTCDDCGETISTTAIPATGHNTTTNTTAATCTTAGKTVETCVTCGKTIKTTTIPATGHNTTTSTTAATCTTAGKTVETCVTCGKTIKTTNLPALGHDYTYTSNNDGTHKISCARCSYSSSASCTMVNNICSYCGYTVEPELPDIPEVPDVPEIPDVPEVPDVPEIPEEPAGELTEGQYVIAANVDGTYYAMANTFSSKITGTKITVTDGKVTAADAEGYVITLSSSGDGWAIEGADGTYLKYNSGTNLSKSTTEYVWTISEGTNGTWRVAAQTEGRGLVFRAKTYNQFGGYATSNISATGTEYYDVELLPIGGSDIGGNDEPTVNSELKISHSLNLASDIAINYVVSAAQLSEYDSFYLECIIPQYEGNSYVGSKTVTVEPVLDGNYYYFTLEGMMAVHMNDEIEATLHMNKGAEESISEVDVYSVGTYAYNQLKKEGVDEGLKSLCANLLRYGGQAQTYKNYRTDARVDAAMTQEQQSFLTDLESVTFGSNNKELADLANPTITWTGKTLSMETKVVIRFVFNTSNYTGSMEDLSLRLSYQNTAGETVNVTLTEITEYHAASNNYSFDFAGLRAADLRSVVCAAIYAGDTQVSTTTMYSADSYGNNKTGDLLTVCQALMAYSDAAKAYFTK